MRINKALSVSNIYSKKHETFPFEGVYKEVFGEPSTNGIWLIYGKEKNGKTWGTLILANYISKMTNKIHYISAEEGVDLEFKRALKRAKIDAKNKRLQFTEYESVGDLYIRLKKQRAPKVVVLDNLTIYNDELKASGIKNLIQDFPNTLFICIAHEERNKPYTASATMASKLAKVLIRVQGLQLKVFGRVPGGTLNIDENKAVLYHGTTTE